MTAVRKKKLTQQPPLVVTGLKPRNPLVAPALRRKAGAHQTPQSVKAKERAEARRAIDRSLREDVKLTPSPQRHKDKP
jgi:hypothetical protein